MKLTSVPLGSSSLSIDGPLPLSLTITLLLLVYATNLTYINKSSNGGISLPGGLGSANSKNPLSSTFGSLDAIYCIIPFYFSYILL